MNYNPQGLIPAIIQDSNTNVVLMMGYMNEAAIEKTKASRLVTFYSRSRQILWTKGETSGHTLKLVSWSLDCDKDTLLIKAIPQGPTCHTGQDTCWGEDNVGSILDFISNLEKVIHERQGSPTEDSYTSSLFKKGTNKIAQKVGEEAVELVIEAMSNNDDLFLEEASDLLFHYLVLLRDRGMGLDDVVKVLRDRVKG